ncbi:hypothetical protein ACRS8P_36375 [Burkholderia cenocepacia]
MQSALQRIKLGTDRDLADAREPLLQAVEGRGRTREAAPLAVVPFAAERRVDPCERIGRLRAQRVGERTQALGRVERRTPAPRADAQFAKADQLVGDHGPRQQRRERQHDHDRLHDRVGLHEEVPRRKMLHELCCRHGAVFL